MFKGVISSPIKVAQNTNIPVSVVKSTNSDIVYDSSTSTIIFNKPGIYDVSFQSVVTDVAVGDISLNELQNGSVVSYAPATTTIAAVTDYETLTISDVITVYPSQVGQKANLSFQLTVASTVSSAIFTIERRR